jgi:hypothetical protein
MFKLKPKNILHGTTRKSFDLHLDQQSVNYLSEAARWSRLLSIVGFIYCGLMAVCGLFLGSMMTRIMTSSMGDQMR